MKTNHPQPSPTSGRALRPSSFVIRHSSASLILLLLASPLLAQETATNPGASLTPEQQKALAATRAGEAPRMPAWMRGPGVAPAAPALDLSQVDRMQAEIARQKEQSEQFTKTHDRLHGGKTKDKSDSSGSSSTSKDPTEKNANAGDFVENYLTVSGIIDRDENNGDSEERKAKEEAEKANRSLESRLTGVSEALLGGGSADPLAALAERLGGITGGTSAAPASGPAPVAGRNPYLAAGNGGGSYALGANGALATREQSSNPYLSAATAASAASRAAPVYTAPVSAVVPAAVAAPPPPPPAPPPPTGVERQRAEEARQKRLFPNRDRF